MCFVALLMQISIYYLLGSGIVDILKKPRLAKTTPSFVNKVSAQNKTLFCIVFSLVQNMSFKLMPYSSTSVQEMPSKRPKF